MVRATANAPAPVLVIAARVLQLVSRRWSGLRPVDSLAYRLGEKLGAARLVLTAKLPTGSRITLDLADHAHRQIFFTGITEAESTAVWRELVTADTILLDVGANVGYYSLLAHDLGAAEVHAFEPNPDVMTLLQRSVASVTTIFANQEACGAVRGTSDLYMPDQSGNSGLATLSGRDAKSSRRVAVAVTTIDAYCRDFDVVPTLIKVDVEGFEGEALRGGADTLRRCRPLVLCEVIHEDTRALMRSLDYCERPVGDFANSLFTPLGPDVGHAA